MYIILGTSTLPSYLSSSFKKTHLVSSHAALDFIIASSLEYLSAKTTLAQGTVQMEQPRTSLILFPARPPIEKSCLGLAIHILIPSIGSRAVVASSHVVVGASLVVDSHDLAEGWPLRPLAAMHAPDHEPLPRSLDLLVKAES